MTLICVLLAANLLLTVSAELPCPCQLKIMPQTGGSVDAKCLDMDLQQVPTCVPNNTRLLAFSGNTLPQVGRHTLEGLPTLRDLVAERCQVANLSADAFQHTPQLHLLNLGHNILHDLPAGVFDNTPHLQTVDLSNNMLRSLPGGLFEKARGLRSLDLSHNHLSALPGNLLGGCAPQSSLRLAGNHLTGLPVQLLQICSSLYSLDVSDNTMTQMQLDVVSTISNLSDLHSLRLEDNMWHCDCSLKPLTMMLLSHKALERHLTCNSPRKVKGEHVVRVVYELDCAPLPDSFLTADPSAHTAFERKNDAAFVALTAVGIVSLVLTASFFVVRHYLKIKSARFNLLNNEEA